MPAGLSTAKVINEYFDIGCGFVWHGQQTDILFTKQAKYDSLFF